MRESIWATTVPQVGEDFRRLSGIEPQVPRLSEEKTPPAPLTVVLPGGNLKGVEVLAKTYKGSPSAMTFANRTQAEKAVEKLGAGWAVRQGARAFYAARVKKLGEVAGSQVGKTILDQMGGAGRIKALLGANFSFTPDGVVIQWPSRHRSRGNVVEIELMPSDTYEMKFFNVSTAGKKLVKKYDDVYADALIDIFERQTGYYLKL